MTADVVDVWRIDLRAPSLAVDALHRRLSAAEQSRAAGFGYSGNRRRFIVAHAAVRAILAGAVEDEPLRWIFGPHGKPALHGADDRPEVNLSHSGELGLLAVCQRRPVGVDVERIRPGLAADALARRFPADERADLRARPAPARAARFATLWTRKEALAKAFGGTMTQVLGQAIPDQASGDQGVVVAAHRVRDLSAGNGFRAAVAVAGEPAFAVHLHSWSWQAPMEGPMRGTAQ